MHIASALTVLFMALSGAAQSQPDRVTTVRILPERDVKFSDGTGTCEGNGRSFNLRRLMPLADRAVEIDGPTGPLRLKLEGEHFYVYALDGGEREVGGGSIANKADPFHDLDIELKLAYFNNELVIYWKETFQNRIYKQGMFRIVGVQAEFVCSGHGGVRTAD